MTLKTNSLALEHPASISGMRIQRQITEILFESVKSKRNVLPDALVEEIEDFTERNSLVIVGYGLGDRRPLHRCCQSCLKAHLVKTAKDLKLNKRVINYILSSFSCAMGHNEYYLDEDKLVKI